MARRVLVCLSFLLVPVLGNAQEIHKCVSGDGVTYQGQPCVGNETAAAMTPPGAPHAARSGSSDSTPECAPRPQSPTRLPWRQATICIGMTDDEVLNLPGWGRPSRIVRSRERRQWREDWTYEARSDARRHLHFVNGKLSTVESDLAGPADAALASLVSVSN